ncbi:hypothetical protein [Pedobacter heparinus]|uniref:Uncharacterized protein n=1 Tax=Pedobacter heparinus (strain ATCC 13125 / DSM 2366 / CIP 104194 / JCM 7457 / NBRC 12017 / NCIMB 9290 / NRRL B-14731 / HIM 762-3) TaxID=485917 RepID=C6Y0C4_PEDHD|nr:hypothetical protein [Pedobacter heparinus]ACU04836.1 hypothetical protein Phep_2633 [Pedobacter heparinus DSM 2366]
MKNIKANLPEQTDHSVIINKDAEFENQSVDPGFEFEPGPDDQHDKDKDEKERKPFKQDEQGTDRGAAGLGELDGTNPGSNHHPMDN